MVRSVSVGGSSELAWFKSSYSGGNDGESCIEVAAASGVVRLRDSKSLAGPQLALNPAAWAGFVSYAQAQERGET
ncbi:MULTISPECIES: DUF397 domain-containing protein [unclassified Streptomyces]|uniref:DUF397 domain-containing protein n=1 Tax=unclassified Streptomyces TaxID=2593676 RepID=UPI0016600C5E|nr:MULTISPECIES: DUF397 domain-containing protein [unclassified Streptomyces]MBD0708971.1 DUF397 domain-containing protein [Streptomyces sp. CBMA291]MBD0716651.1 DUF397 domain-containing protein [Streptomyces sp. CBMA370]